MRFLKNLILTLGIISVPYIYNRAKDFYLTEVLLPRVEPTKIRGRTYGAAFQIEHKGEQLTLTNKHICIDNSTGKPFKYIDIGGNLRRVYAISDRHDLCILEPNKELGAFKLADSSSINDQVRIIGFPRGMAKTIRRGRIIDTQFKIFSWLGNPSMVVAYNIVTSIGYPGSSGSPVINNVGNVVGIVFAGTPRYHTEMYIVPLYAIRQFLEEPYE